QLGHLAIEKRQQQRAYVRPVDVSVAQQDYPVIAKLGHVEIVRADAGAERGDHRANFRVPEHLVVSRLLDVQDFALERKDCLRAPITTLFGGAAGGVSLDDEYLAERGIFLGAIRELARKRR